MLFKFRLTLESSYDFLVFCMNVSKRHTGKYSSHMTQMEIQNESFSTQHEVDHRGILSYKPHLHQLLR